MNNTHTIKYQIVGLSKDEVSSMTTNLQASEVIEKKGFGGIEEAIVFVLMELAKITIKEVYEFSKNLAGKLKQEKPQDGVIIVTFTDESGKVLSNINLRNEDIDSLPALVKEALEKIQK